MRSMKAAPVIWPSSKPSSMCWMRLGTCEQHDFPGLKPTPFASEIPPHLKDTMLAAGPGKGPCFDSKLSGGRFPLRV